MFVTNQFLCGHGTFKLLYFNQCLALNFHFLEESLIYITIESRDRDVQHLAHLFPGVILFVLLLEFFWHSFLHRIHDDRAQYFLTEGLQIT